MTRGLFSNTRDERNSKILGLVPEGGVVTEGSVQVRAANQHRYDGVASLQALAELKEKGLISSDRTPDGQVVYIRNKELK